MFIGKDIHSVTLLPYVCQQKHAPEMTYMYHICKLVHMQKRKPYQYIYFI